MTRWTKNVEKRHDTLGSHEIPEYCAEVDEALQLNQTGVRFTEANIRALIDDEPRSNIVVVQNRNISRNKGCGSRIKSGKEKSMDAINAKRRKCSKCGEAAGHNARSCPGPKK
ncbi:hypothetical protein POM88_042997 [Heracleum sosnowskyi]|uniref:Uncharacterized protein n=1 Tax=Heracleum sosnowskyi TaxID=360622 RepID=A0AAD8HIX1_9APIA|nr:hypothetical protein POM88_042997 [Heracleum sosnowskyi]